MGTPKCEDWTQYQEAVPPSAAWYWSETNGEYRKRPAKFRWDRAGIHFPVGIVLGLLGGEEGGWQFDICATGLFLAYEIRESDAIRDRAYPDIAGYLFGYAGQQVLRRLELVEPLWALWRFL